LVNRVIPVAALEEQTVNLAKRLAVGPSLAYAHTKALINSSLQSGFEDQLEQERASFVKCAASAEFAEGVTAFLEKRIPKFG
jgi:2-(1,2-epoxy-1,2-dihydrophenyl)acetyl-CoA isomerase